MVERYAGLVFGVALQRRGDRPLAEEAVRNVFADLARKAPALAGTHRPLAAWLHRCAVYESITLLRGKSATGKK
ncbi:MAG: sigE 1 [Verrucomicrobiales bacterium]|nr:sigE 1 [Verrucomicrobiales bacterium]